MDVATDSWDEIPEIQIGGHRRKLCVLCSLIYYFQTPLFLNVLQKDLINLILMLNVKVLKKCFSTNSKFLARLTQTHLLNTLLRESS